METNTTQTSPTQEQLSYRVLKVREARAEIMESSDFPGIETKHEAGNGYPGLPCWDKPEDGDWRIVNTSMHDGYVVLTEECIGYSETSHYDFEDFDGETSEGQHQYYVSVAPGYRATRLRKVWLDDIHMASIEKDGGLSE